MRFAHFADVHIGSWRDQKLREISVKAFLKAADICMKEGVDFIIISGDLFNTSVPSIDSLKEAVKKLKELKDKGIPIYGIAGSHDFSASGKTMLDVLENAGLYRNVFKGRVQDKKLYLDFTADRKTGAKMTGIIGRKGMLDRRYYEMLDKAGIEKEQGYKIFLFHTAISEIKPKELERMDAAPMDYLPKGFNYYAGGHVHYIFNETFPGYGRVAYPGALFPTNFHDLEKYSRGGFYIVDVDEKGHEEVEWRPVQIVNTFHMKINCAGKLPKEIEEEILRQVEGKEFINTIITMRLGGKLRAGKAADINFKPIYDLLNEKSAYYIMKSAHAIESEEFREAEAEPGSVEEAEADIIRKNLGQTAVDGMDASSEEEFFHKLMGMLSMEKDEGEKSYDYERRLLDEITKIIDMT